ncbi:MAG: hypothetical protein IPP56_02165 [Bacteroidetes bacterium]|nr:hypothetical protein [Bacteroidota bacterium]
MKNIFLLASMAMFFLFGCSSQTANEKKAAASDSTQTAALYVCPMHPEVTSESRYLQHVRNGFRKKIN